jgi:hypothetical protein
MCHPAAVHHAGASTAYTAFAPAFSNSARLRARSLALAFQKRPGTSWKLGDNWHPRETCPPCSVKSIADYADCVTWSDAETAHRFGVLPLHRGVELPIDFLLREVARRPNNSRNQHDSDQSDNDRGVPSPRAGASVNSDGRQERQPQDDKN